MFPQADYLTFDLKNISRIIYLGSWTWAASHKAPNWYNWARAIGAYPDEPTRRPDEDCVFKTTNPSVGEGWADEQCEVRAAKGMHCYSLCQYGAVPT